MTNSPRAALLIAAFNAETTVERAVRSALAQPEIAEIIVIDDASTDATSDRARASDDGAGRLIILRQRDNAGPSAARNLGLEHASAEWIGILDADDYLLPGRVARMLQHAGGADFIADALIRVPAPGDLAEAETALNQATPSAPIQVDFAAFVAGNLARRHGADLGFVKPLMRRAFLERQNLRYRPEMRLGEDYELYARALAVGARFALLPPLGYVSVDRPGSLSNRHTIEDLRQLRDCDDALAQIRPLEPNERDALRRHRQSVDQRLQWRLLIEAVKAKDVGAAFRVFHSPDVAAYLAVRLAEQAWLRGAAKLGLGPKSA